ncbi:MAG: primosomal protein N' [Gammaproteobacteria bacterium]|nr:primosomal protein N' [Gammaproteobacteria bacterium]
MPDSKNTAYEGLVYQVAIPTPLRKLFDYLPSKSKKTLQPGLRVLVPFGRRHIVGFIISIKSGSSIPSKNLKRIDKILDEQPLFSNKLLKLLQWSAGYYQHPIGEVLSTAIPKKIRSANPANPISQVWKSYSSSDKKGLISLRNSPKQKGLLNLIQKQKGLTKESITKAGFNSRAIKELEKKQLIYKQTKTKPLGTAFKPLSRKNLKSLDLNKQQKKALTAIIQIEEKFKCFLIDGVTGSGKTEVYMQAMQQQLCKGRQCLVLVPEIGLTPQTLFLFQERFECPVISIHSGLTDNERLAAWNMAKDGSAGILIGTRSAIFTPFANLGLIVVDEEHDSSFKQQEGFKYSARDISIVRAQEEKLPIILGSATPSLESLHNIATKKFVPLSLTKRAGNATESTKIIIDTSHEFLEHGLSERLLYKIKQHLAAKKQVLIFINRRGFAPTLSCQKCDWIAECKNCISQMTVHIKPPNIRCHHCGVILKLPTNCPYCNNSNLESIGLGTQRLEKFLQARFESIPVLRIDRDSTRRKKLFQSMLEKINTGKSCILLGTQMISKGHHFPNITLVAIVNADTGLFSPDFRGQEQMAQTITQVSGRAGRASSPGEVVIQSRHASHVTLKNLMNNSYSDFAKYLLQERLTTNMPPFSQLALIKAQAKQLGIALSFLKKVKIMSVEISSNFNDQVTSIGPIPAPIEKRAGMFRTQLILKTKKKSTLQEFIHLLVLRIEDLKIPSGIRWSVDVDPNELT